MLLYLGIYLTIVRLTLRCMTILVGGGVKARKSGEEGAFRAIGDGFQLGCIGNGRRTLFLAFWPPWKAAR